MEELAFTPEINVGRRLSCVKEFSHQDFYDELTRGGIAVHQGDAGGTFPSGTEGYGRQSARGKGVE